MKNWQAILIAGLLLCLALILTRPHGSSASFQSMQPVSGTPSGSCVPPLVNVDVNTLKSYYCGSDNLWHIGAGQVGFISCTQATPCPSSATTVATASATTLHRINAAVTCTATGAAATVILTVKYTDPSNTVQTLTLSTATCTALGSLSIASLDQGATISSGTNVQYSVATVNSPSYQARVAVYQEGMN